MSLPALRVHPTRQVGLRLNGARAGDYVASKHALVGLHASLRRELDRIHGCARIRTSLVVLGRLRTPLFASMHYGWLAEVLAPTLDPACVARDIVQLALARHSSEDIYRPFYAHFAPALRLAPSWLQDLAHWITGADEAMQ